MLGIGTDMVEWQKRAKARLALALSVTGKLPEVSIREILEDGILKATKKDVTFWAKQFFRKNEGKALDVTLELYIKKAVNRYGGEEAKDRLYREWKSLTQKGTLTEFAEEIVRIATALSLPERREGREEERFQLPLGRVRWQEVDDPRCLPHL